MDNHSEGEATNHLHLLILYYIRCVKVVSYLLSIYILILACMKCEDTYCYDHVDRQINVTTQTHSSQGQQNDCCSPLCSCACCSNSVTLINKISTTFISFPSKISFGYYATPSTAQLVVSIWQPPKIS